MDGVYYGYYSHAAVSAGHDWWMYKTEDGNDVAVTLVATKELTAADYRWTDMRCVGRVTEFVRPGKPSRHHQPKYRDALKSA